jgi:hypothetical protein
MKIEPVFDHAGKPAYQATSNSYGTSLLSFGASRRTVIADMADLIDQARVMLHFEKDGLREIK